MTTEERLYANLHSFGIVAILILLTKDDSPRLFLYVLFVVIGSAVWTWFQERSRPDKTGAP